MNTTASTSQRQDAQTGPVPLPPGADLEWVDAWQENLDGVQYRLVWSGPAELREGISDLDIRAVVTQYQDGSIATDGEDHPEVYVGDTSYTPADAFLVANAIIKAVFQAVRWSGGAK